MNDWNLLSCIFTCLFFLNLFQETQFIQLRSIDFGILFQSAAYNKICPSELNGSHNSLLQLLQDRETQTSTSGSLSNCLTFWGYLKTKISKVKKESLHFTQLSSSNKSPCMKAKCTSVKKVSSKGSAGPQENSDISVWRC